MLVYEYKLSGTKQQYVAIDEAVRIVHFIHNKSLRLWMDKTGTSKNDLQTNCAVLVREYPFAKRLNSQARQAAADRAWFAISRFKEEPPVLYCIIGGAKPCQHSWEKTIMQSLSGQNPNQ